MGVDAVRVVLGLVAVCERARRGLDARERPRLGMGMPVAPLRAWAELERVGVLTTKGGR